MTTAALPTPAWPASSLIRSLARAGWGDLAGRQWQGVRTTLRALVDALPDKSATGETTVNQLANNAGLSERWVRRCLHILEDAGLIKWHRGNIEAGRPRPSVIRINKRRIVDLIRDARPAKAIREALHATATRERLARLRSTWIKNKGARFRRSAHAELSAGLHPLRGGTGAERAPESPQTSLHTSAHRQTAPPRCEHGVEILQRTATGAPACPMCRALTRS